MRTNRITILMFAAVLVAAALSAGAVPRLVNYQGFLTDDAAVPLNGPYNLAFKIYPDSAQSAQAVWTELHSGVDVSDGLFSVILGGTTFLPDSLWEGGDLWMGVTVGGDPEMVPRMRLTSVPWALRAAVADSALASPAGSADGHSLDAADGLPVDALYVDNDGNVGVGTLVPGAKLDVVGTLVASGFKMPTGAESGYVLVSDSAGVGTWQAGGMGAGDITAVRPMDGLWSPDTGESGDVHLYVLVVPGGGLMVDPIDGVSIEPEGVTEEKLASGAVTAAKIDSAAVTGSKIAAAAVGPSALASAAVTNDKLSTYAVADSNLIANSVTTDKLLNSAVKRDKIDNLAINADKLDANAVTSAKIQDNTISFSDIAQNGASEGQVMKWTGGHWSPRDDSLGGGGTITGVEAGVGLTGGGASGTVTLDVDFGGSGVDTTVARSDHNHDASYVNEGQAASISDAMLVDRAVTTAKLDTNAVTTDKILTGTILFQDIGQNGASDGQVIKWSGTASAWTAGNDSVGSGGSGSGGWYDGGTVVRLEAADDSVGIGTDVPKEKLDVDGSVRATGKAAFGPGHVYTGTYTFVAGENNTASGDHSAVGGGRFNSARGDYSVVSGGGGGSAGQANRAHGGYAVISGGYYNLAGDSTMAPIDNAYTTIGGGGANAAYTRGSTVAGGFQNSAGVYSGGGGPPFDGEYATIGGGRGNRAEGTYSVVSGGGSDNPFWFNRAFSDYSVVGGGSRNTAGDTLATPDDDEYATVSGGFNNGALARGATVGGGSDNTVGQFGGGSPDEDGDYGTIGGGRFNLARGKYSVVSGGGTEMGPWANRAEGDYAVVGGGEKNVAGNGDPPETATHATVSGGEQNQAMRQYSTVGGGSQNTATAPASVVSGGTENTATATNSTVGGGHQNTASGTFSAVGGGEDNFAAGQYAGVPGGWENTAAGDYSFAAGSVAKANHDGCVVISATNSGTPGDSVWTNGTSEMVLRADGGFYLTDQSEQSAISGFLNTSTGAWLSDAGQWRDASSRELKENFTDVDKSQILEKLADLPVSRWNYKVDDDGITHVGPVAQDFYAAFGVGDDDVSLAALDVAGVSLAAIQELIRRNRDQEKELSDLKTQVRELTKQVRALTAEKKEVTATDRVER